MASRDYLSGGGDMGALMRATDWSRTVFGPSDSWPQSLRTAVSIMLESRFAMLVAWGPEFRFLYNDRYTPVLGTKHPASLGTPCAEIFPEVWDVIGPEFERVWRGESFAVDDWLLPLDRNGYLENCWFTLSYSPIRDETGGVGGVLAVVVETTGRVESERRLATLRELARRAADAKTPEQACVNAATVLAANAIDVPFALVFLLDEQGRLARRVCASGLPDDHPANVERVGLDAEEPDPWRLGDVARTGDTLVLPNLAQRFGRGLPGGPYDEATHTAVLLPLSRPGMGQLRSVAEAANRAKDEFLATLSHELRTPINAIMGWSHQRGVLDAEQTARAVDAIVRNASAQGRLIDDLLDVSRIISGRLRLDVELVDLPSIVSGALATVEPAAQAKGVRIQTIVDDRGARVYGDRQRLQQVLWNLLSNAVKFTPRGGRVQLHALRVNSHLEVIVSDTGQGIPGDVLPFVFDRFRQGAAGSSRQHTGLGLGLAIARHLVELHGGTVEAESDGVGRGATFRVTLPLSVAKAARPASEEFLLAHPAVPTVTTASLDIDLLPDLRGCGVLVVEDDPDAREMVAYLLRRRNAAVTVAPSADEALRQMDHGLPDVILSDIEMAGQDGYQLIRSIRMRPSDKGGAVPAAALTAYSRPEDRARSLLAGFDAHLSKPVDLAELVAMVARLRHSRGGAQGAV